MQEHTTRQTKSDHELLQEVEKQQPMVVGESSICKTGGSTKHGYAWSKESVTKPGKLDCAPGNMTRRGS